MMSRLPLLPRAAALLCMAAGMGCSAATRIQDAVVTEHAERPCFGTGNAAQMRRLQAVIVSDVSKLPATPIWESTGAAFVHAERGCIAYGESLSGSADPGQAAPPLQAGRVYHVFLNLRRENPGDPTYGYEAEFCLKKSASGQAAVVHQIPWDKTLRRRSRDVCGGAKPP